MCSLSSLGASPSLSPVTSPSHSPPALSSGSSSSLATRLPVEFPDTADFLTKPSVNLNLHKPLGHTVSASDFQQAFRGATFPLCTRWSMYFWSLVSSVSKLSLSFVLVRILMQPLEPCLCLFVVAVVVRCLREFLAATQESLTNHLSVTLIAGAQVQTLTPVTLYRVECSHSRQSCSVIQWKLFCWDFKRLMLPSAGRQQYCRFYTH